MPVFVYQALQAGGGKTTGEIEALSRQDAFSKLRAQSLQPFSLAAKGAEAAASAAAAKSTGDNILNRQQVLLFTEELCELLEAGLKLARALQVIEQRQDKSSLREVAASARQSLREGMTFSAALKKASPSFSELYCNMVKAGEASGTVSKILKRQVEFLTMMGDLQRRVTSALIYPSVIFAAGSALLGIFMTFLLPQLTVMLTKTGKTLPMATRILIGISEFFASYWWVMLTALAAGVLAGYPTVDVRAVLTDGQYHDVDSSEIAFKIAAIQAFKEAAERAKPVILEPIMKVEVVTPEQFMGDVTGTVTSKRGAIESMEERGMAKVINAKVPLSEMFGYTTQLRSMTEGRASWTMEFDHYEVVPTNVAEAIKAARK